MKVVNDFAVVDTLTPTEAGPLATVLPPVRTSWTAQPGWLAIVMVCRPGSTFSTCASWKTDSCGA